MHFKKQTKVVKVVYCHMFYYRGKNNEFTQLLKADIRIDNS